MKKRIHNWSLALAGWVVLLSGLVMVPYPGPGWLVVFAGLAILSRQYTWAERLLKFGRSKYENWQNWVSLQKPYIKALLISLTCLVTIITIWLVNGYGLINDWLNLGLDWLKSPIAFLR